MGAILRKAVSWSGSGRRFESVVRYMAMPTISVTLFSLRRHPLPGHFLLIGGCPRSGRTSVAVSLGAVMPARGTPLIRGVLEAAGKQQPRSTPGVSRRIHAV